MQRHHLLQLAVGPGQDVVFSDGEAAALLHAAAADAQAAAHQTAAAAAARCCCSARVAAARRRQQAAALLLLRRRRRAGAAADALQQREGVETHQLPHQRQDDLAPTSYHVRRAHAHQRQAQLVLRQKARVQLSEATMAARYNQ